MSHAIYKVSSFEHINDYTLRVFFDDGTAQLIDFLPILAGELFGPLRDPELFRSVKIDSEVHTLVWANGADFDPETLHDWSAHEQAMKEMTKRWEPVKI